MNVKVGDQIPVNRYSDQNGATILAMVTEICPHHNGTCINYCDYPCVRAGRKFITVCNESDKNIWIDEKDEMPWCDEWEK